MTDIALDEKALAETQIEFDNVPPGLVEAIIAVWNRRASPSQVAPQPQAGEAVAYEPCGGCGEKNPDKRCIGCLHPFAALASPQPANPAQIDGGQSLHTAAAVLIAKLDGIHNDPDYKRVWEIAQLHGGPYVGPNYINELAKLRQCLSSTYQPQVGGLRYRPLEFDDWGIIRNANDDGIFAVVRRPISEEEAAQHRSDKTDPFEPLARSLIAAIGAGGQAVAWQQRELKNGQWSDWYPSNKEAYEEHHAGVEGALSRYEVRALYSHQPHPTDERVVEALREAEETLQLVEHPAFPDPVHHEEVKRLGRRIGFGALMSTASAAWREELAEHGDPIGGELVAGPCHSSIVRALSIVRDALSAKEGQ